MRHPAVKEFLRLLAEVDRSKTRTEVFADFCELAYCAMAKLASPYAGQRDRLEAQYMQVVARYRDKDDVRKMPYLLTQATLAITPGGMDFMGHIAGEIGALDARLGQFFTPYEVSKLMAEMILTDAADTIQSKGFMTIQEPAAGAGGMIVAAADMLQDRKIDLDDIWVEAIELSRRTFHMLYVQMSLRGIAGKVICGNTLSLEAFEVVYTPAALLFLRKHGHPFADQLKKAEDADAAKRKKRDLIGMLEEQHISAAE